MTLLARCLLHRDYVPDLASFDRALPCMDERRVPIIGDGGGVFSFTHAEDAAAATILAVNHGQAGFYNIVDDEPVPLREWLPIYAELLHAPRPLRLPKLIGRLAAGRFPTVANRDLHDHSNP